MRKKELKKKLWLAALWLLLLGGSLTGAVFAWFTFSPDTNVQPLQGNMVRYEPEVVENVITETITETVTEQLPDELKLEICDTKTGEYSTNCVLSFIGGDELFPISTADQKKYFLSIRQSEEGISQEYTEITEYVDEYSLHGNFYLKVTNGSCDVVLDKNNTSFKSANAEQQNNQILAASRLGLVLRDADTDDLIMSGIYDLSNMGDTGDALIRRTIPEDKAGSVVTSLESDGSAVYVKDPASDLSPCFTTPMFHINDGQIIQVEYRLYLEGCDDNCYNVVMDSQIAFNFGFAVA